MGIWRKTLYGLAALAVAAGAATAAAPTASAAGTKGDAALQGTIDSYVQAYGGVQISANQIAWRNGTVVLTFPVAGSKVAQAPGERATTLGTANCPRSWSCLYADANFGGRRLQFSDCQSEYLPDWGFRDQTSSWHNNQTGGAVSIVYNYVGSTPQEIWRAPVGSSTYVGDGNNDKADAMRTC
jgi:FtsP/CotA-like multicopper oxidase with cupredoxin domain